MNQLNNFVDNRLLVGCIYCGSYPGTKDHVPSKCILDKPYPENLPVVPCCYECNQSFSHDEQYFACFIECVRCGTTNPEGLGRTSIIQILKKSPALRDRIRASMVEVEGRTAFLTENDRIENVLLKLARGHAAFELSVTKTSKPDHFWWGLLSNLLPENRTEFESVHFQNNVGEVGSKSMQRFLITNLSMEDGSNLNLIINDWIDVQDSRYRYIAIDDMGLIIIRIVIDEFFACEVVWEY